MRLYIRALADSRILMLPLFTPRAPKVKPEPGVEVTPLGPPDTPWAMRVVVKKEHLVRVEPERKPRLKPWPSPPRVEPVPAPPPHVEPAPPPRVHAGQPRPPEHGPPSWREEAAHKGATIETTPDIKASQARRLVTARNYAAIEHGQERYGLIDSGAAGPARELIVHVRKKFGDPFRVLNGIRAGSVLTAKRGARQGQLRVRFTTPARYYSPGCPVTTLNIGVDETDWQSLMAGARGI